MNEFQSNEQINPETVDPSKAELQQTYGDGDADEELETVEEQVVETTDRLDVLINLMIKKGLITEQEIESEYENWLNEKGEGDEDSSDLTEM